MYCALTYFKKMQCEEMNLVTKYPANSITAGHLYLHNIIEQDIEEWDNLLDTWMIIEPGIINDCSTNIKQVNSIHGTITQLKE